MALPPRLQADLEALGWDPHDLEVVEDGARYNIILKGFPVPDGRYIPARTDLMVMADYQYPASRMDMFWTDPPLICANGSQPQGANSIETYAGRRWQRWSWHYSVWNPAKHNVRTHLEVVRDRLARGG